MVSLAGFSTRRSLNGTWLVFGAASFWLLARLSAISATQGPRGSFLAPTTPAAVIIPAHVWLGAVCRPCSRFTRGRCDVILSTWLVLGAASIFLLARLSAVSATLGPRGFFSAPTTPAAVLSPALVWLGAVCRPCSRFTRGRCDVILSRGRGC